MAYPYGKYNNNAISAVKEAGIDMAFTVKRGYVTKDSDPLRLKRLTVYRETSLSRIAAYMENAWPETGS